MSDYEKYRAMQEADQTKDDIYNKPDSGSSEDMAKKKGMERYSQNDMTDSMDNQNYQQPSDDSVQQGTTIINNYYEGYPDRFGWYHNFYFDYCYDPFFYGVYDPLYWGWGFSWGWPYWGFGMGWYGYNYGGGWYGHHGGYYNNGYYYNGRGYTNTGGARRSMSGYGNLTSLRRSSPLNGQMYGTSAGRRISSNITADKYGESYASVRRNPYQLYQKSTSTSANNTVSTTRRETNINSANRYKSVQTTRPGTSNNRRNSVVNNTKVYTPSYSTQRNSTRTQYNNYSSNVSRRGYYNSGSTKSYSVPYRSGNTPAASGYTSGSSGHSYTPSRSSSSSGSHYNGSGGGNRSSGGGSSSSSHGGGGGGGGGHRR
jgi:hypothetical protein